MPLLKWQMKEIMRQLRHFPLIFSLCQKNVNIKMKTCNIKGCQVWNSKRTINLLWNLLKLKTCFTRKQCIVDLFEAIYLIAERFFVLFSLCRKSGWYMRGGALMTSVWSFDLYELSSFSKPFHESDCIIYEFRL